MEWNRQACVWMGVFTCLSVEVLIVDNQAGSHAGVRHLVAIRVCFFLPDGATVQFLSSGLCIWPKYLYIHTVVSWKDVTFKQEDLVWHHRAQLDESRPNVFWRILFLLEYFPITYSRAEQSIEHIIKRAISKSQFCYWHFTWFMLTQQYETL